MKTQNTSIFLLALLLSLSISSITTKSLKKTTKLMKTAGPADKNKYYQLFLGFMFGAAGKVQDITAINSCLPKGWLSVDNAPIEDKEPTPDKTTFTKVVDGFEKVVDFVCTFKDKITEKISNAIKNRVTGKDTSFVQLGTKGPSDAMKKLKEKANAKFEEMKKLGLKKADWAKKKFADLKDFADAVEQKFKDIGFKAASTILKFFGKVTIDQIIAIIKCGKLLKGFKDGLMDVINGIISKVNLFTRIAAQDYTALAELLVGLICNFSVFREAFGYLSSAVAEKVLLPKFNMIGKFIGTAVRALST